MEPVRRYFAAYSSVLREGLTLPGQKGRFISVVVADALATLCEGGVVLLLARTASLAAQPMRPSPIGEGSIGQYFFDTLSRIATGFGIGEAQFMVLLAVVTSCLLLAISVILRFVAAKHSRKLARCYHMAIVERVVDEAVSPEKLTDISGEFDERELKTTVAQRSIHVSKSLEVLSRLFQALAFLAVATLAAFSVNWRLMFLITGLGALFVPAALIAMRVTHSSSQKFFNKGGSLLSSKVEEVLREARWKYVPVEAATAPGRDLLRSSTVLEYFELFDSIQLASARMMLFSGLMRLVLFSIGTGAIAYYIMTTDHNFSRIVIFACTLMLALRYVQGCLSYVSTLNLYYPQVARYLAVNGKTADRPITKSELPAIKTLVDPGFDGGAFRLKTAAMVSGMLIDVVTHAHLSRFQVSQWLHPLFRGVRLSPGDVAFCTVKSLNMTQSQNAPYTRSRDRSSMQAIDACLVSLGMSDAARAVGRGATDSSEGSAALAVAEILTSGASDVFVDSALILQLPEAMRGRLRNVLGDVRLYVLRDPSELLAIAPDLHIVLRDKAVSGLFKPGVGPEILATCCGIKTARETGTFEIDETLVH